MMRNLMTTALATLALALMAGPALAADQEAKPAASATVAAGDYNGGLEFLIGFGGATTASGDGIEVEADLSPTLGITPWMEKKFGSAVGIGGEMNFLWFKPSEGADERQLVLSPHLRLRMSFPIIEKVTFDGTLGVGPSIWTARGDAQRGDVANETRFGWSLRFAFGGSYAINKAVSVYGNLGYYTSQTFGDDLTAEMDTIPLAVGLRGNF